VLVSGLGGGGWWVAKAGSDQKEMATPTTSGCARFGVGWWWLVGIEGWWQPERSGNPKNEHLLLVSGLGGGGWWVSKGGGDQKEVATPRMSTCFSFSELRVVVTTRERLPENEPLCSFRSWEVMAGVH